jgi:GDPmannose 4,6-dehydratase
MFACNGILFNHESPKRGETFITRKITRGLCNIALGIENCLYVGNIDAKRDWGHAKDYVEMQWLMLQQDKPNDYVIATGYQISVREFIVMSCKELGIEIQFTGTGLNEKGVVISIDKKITPSLKVNDVIVKIDKKYFRPSEVDSLLGDPSKAKKELNWMPKISLEDLCKEMIEEDYNKTKQKILLKESGFEVFTSLEDL